MADDLGELTKQVIAFRDDRDWKQFHNPKDVAISLSLEAAEYLELYQWKGTASPDQVAKERVGEELADILYWVLLASHDQGVNLYDALRKKLAANAAKYPVHKVRGKATKYTEL